MIQRIASLNRASNIIPLPVNGNKKKRKEQKTEVGVAPDPTIPPVVQVDQARDELISAINAQKIDNPSDFLISQPQRPELDVDTIQKNQKLARTAALIQAIDAAGDVTDLAIRGDNAIVAPSQLQNLGFSAFQNIQLENQAHREALQQFRLHSQKVNQQNKEIQRETQQFNKEIDVEVAKLKLEEALGKEKAASITADKDREEIIDTAQRLISTRNASAIKAAGALLKEAGLTNKESEKFINSIQTETTKTTKETQGKGTGTDQSLTGAEKNAIREYHRLKEEVSNLDTRLTNPDDDPRVKQMRFLEKELGTKIFSPRELWDPDFTKPEGVKLTQEERQRIIQDNETAINQIGNAFSNGDLDNANEAIQRIIENNKKIGISEKETERQLNEIFDPNSDFNSFDPKQALGSLQESTNEQLRIQKLNERYNQRFGGFQDLSDNNQLASFQAGLQELADKFTNSRSPTKEREQAEEDFIFALIQQKIPNPEQATEQQIQKAQEEIRGIIEEIKKQNNQSNKTKGASLGAFIGKTNIN